MARQQDLQDNSVKNPSCIFHSPANESLLLDESLNKEKTYKRKSFEALHHRESSCILVSRQHSNLPSEQDEEAMNCTNNYKKDHILQIHKHSSWAPFESRKSSVDYSFFLCIVLEYHPSLRSHLLLLKCSSVAFSSCSNCTLTMQSWSFASLFTKSSIISLSILSFPFYLAKTTYFTTLNRYYRNFFESFPKIFIKTSDKFNL